MIDTTLISKNNFLYTNGTSLFVSMDSNTWTNIGDLQSGYNLSNVQVIKIYDYYYFIGESGLFKTKDFQNYTSIDITQITQNSDYKSLKNFKMFFDENNKYHISYSGTNNSNFSAIYIADFNIVNDSISNTFQEIKTTNGESYGQFIYLNKMYYLFLDGNHVYVSSNLSKDYIEIATNINNGSNQYTNLFCEQAGDYIYLYELKNSSQMVYRIARALNPIIWSNETVVNKINLPGGFFYSQVSQTYTLDESALENTFDPIVTIKALGVEQKSILSCLIWSSFVVTWSQNNSYQIEFTVYNDNSISYNLLQVESSIFFNGQEYIVKTCEPNYESGVNTKQVVATHIYNELQYVRQHNTNTGTLTYTVNQVLDFYLGTGNATANYRGFTYLVHGDFDKQQITDLGNNSAKDCLSTIISQWTNAIIFPDNKIINVYTPEAFEKDFGRRIDYLNSASSVTLTVDSTGITNQVYCVGKSYENSDDNNTTEYYFPPFYVSDDVSIKTWGLHPMDDIDDDRFTIQDNMKTYAYNQLQLDPIVSIEVTDMTNNVPLAGETRHLKINNDYEISVMLIGYSWYPFSKTNSTVLDFDNLPVSILDNQSKLNNKIKNIEQLTQQALNKANNATKNYISVNDPTTDNTVRVGDIWTRKLSTESSDNSNE